MKIRYIIPVLLVPMLVVTTSHSYDLNLIKLVAKKRYGEQSYASVVELNLLLINLRMATDKEKLEGINKYFNDRITFMSDLENWGVSDYWATPLETIGKMAGDCEDFTIAKFVFLKELKISEDKLRLFYVRADNINNDLSLLQNPTAHLVLSYYETPTSDPLILDNINHKILPASLRADLFPVFSFNSLDIWAADREGVIGKSKKHISRWRDVLNRIDEDLMQPHTLVQKTKK